MYVYYPSCNFKRFFPETARRIQAYLETQPDVRITGCCHLPASRPEPEETVVTICMSCMRMLAEEHPALPRLNFFEFLLTRPDFAWPDLSGQRFLLQDCFRARGEHGLQDAVRTCLTRCGAAVDELPENRDETRYDGNFLLHPPFPGALKRAPHYYGEVITPFLTVLPQEEWLDWLRRNAERYGGAKVVGYCNTCVNGAKAGGADAVHLAELLFPAG